MSDRFSITQRLRAALHANPADPTLAEEMLDRDIKESREYTKRVEHELTRRVKVLEDIVRDNHPTNTGVQKMIAGNQAKEKVSLLTWAIRVALVPMTIASLGFIWKLIRN
jgi:hypothetical protein